jgi:hypothetical protein
MGIDDGSSASANEKSLAITARIASGVFPNSKEGRCVRHVVREWSVVLLLSVFGSAAASEAGIAPDRMLVVDGTRTFVLGLYENPTDDVVLAQIAAAGFNLVRASADVAALGRLHAAGLHAWVNTGGAIDLSRDRDKQLQSLREMAASCGAHPALWVWEVPDEALWNCWYSAFLWRSQDEPKQLREHVKGLQDTALRQELERQIDESRRLSEEGDFAASEQLADATWKKLGLIPPNPELNISNASERAAALCDGMVRGHAAMKEMDASHPIWMNHAPRNQISQLAAFNRAADIVGCDIYPVPEYRVGHSDLGDRSLSSVGAYTERMQAAAPGKPVWMVLQGFGWADLGEVTDAEQRKNGRRPDFDESRFMAFDAIVRGARGVLYWGTEYIEKNSTLCQDLTKLVRELADLQPVLSAPDSEIVPGIETAETPGSVDRCIRVLGKKVDGAVWWLIVNEFQDPLDFTLCGLDVLEGTTYSEEAAGRRATVINGRLPLRIRGHGVQVWRPSPGNP